MMKNAKSLVSLWRKAASAYQDGASAYRDALGAAVQLKSEKVPLDSFFNFLSASFSFGEVLKFADSLLENASALQKEAAEREKLLAGQIETVAPRALCDPIPQKSSGPALTLTLETALSWREEAMNAVILRKCGPIFYELAQYDGVPTTHQFFVYLLKGPSSERRTIKFTLADQYYFIDAKEMLEKDNLTHLHVKMRPLLKASVPYIFRQAEVSYRTLDLGYWADLATIADFQWRGQLLNQTLVRIQKSSLFNLMVRHFNRYTRGYTNAQRNALSDNTFNNAIKPLLWVYVGRSGPSMLFLTHNRSVWRLPERFKFNAAILIQPYMKTFEEVASRLSPENLKKTLRREAWQ